MFTIEKKMDSYIFVRSIEDNKKCVFPIEILECAKKRKPHDIKRNRVKVTIDGAVHIFRRKEWTDSSTRTSYRIIQDNYETIIGSQNKMCVILSSGQDFVIVPHDEFQNAQGRKHEKSKRNRNGVTLILSGQIFHFSNEQWANAESLANVQQKSYTEIVKLIRMQIREQKMVSSRQAKQKAYR